MLCDPLCCPSVNLHVLNDALALAGSASAEIAGAAPRCRKQVLVLALAAVEVRTQPSKTTNKQVESGGVCVNEKLMAVGIAYKAEHVVWRLALNVGHGHSVYRLTRPKISDRWRGRAWLQAECGSHRKLERGAASGSLHRLVRCFVSLHV